MKDVILSVITGGLAGAIFAFAKLPVPAPPVFAGVAGIVGLWAGYSIITNVLN